MVALTGKDRLPIVMLSKDKEALIDVAGYKDEFGLFDTLTEFNYTAGLPGAASNSFQVNLTVINPTQEFERAVTPVFRNLFANSAKTSSLGVGQTTAEIEPIKFYMRWGYGSEDQGMSKLVTGILTNVNYSVTDDAERVISLTFMDTLSFDTTKNPNVQANNGVAQTFEYPDILKDDGSLVAPSEVVKDLLGQILGAFPNLRGVVYHDIDLSFIDKAWAELTNRLSDGFGSNSAVIPDDGDYSRPLDAETQKLLDSYGIGEDTQWVGYKNLIINGAGSPRWAARQAYDMVFRYLGISFGASELKQNRSESEDTPKNPQARVNRNSDKPLPKLNDIRLGDNLRIVRNEGFIPPTDTGLTVRTALLALNNEDDPNHDFVRNEVFNIDNSRQRWERPPELSGSIDGSYASDWGFPNAIPWRPFGYGFHGESKDGGTATPAQVFSIAETGYFPLNKNRSSSTISQGFYVAVANSQALWEATTYATAVSVFTDEGDNDAKTHAKQPEPEKTPPAAKPKPFIRASITKNEYTSLMTILNALIRSINDFYLPILEESDNAFEVRPYYKSTLQSAGPPSFNGWERVTTTFENGNTPDDTEALLVVADGNTHKRALTNDAADRTSEIQELAALQSFPSLSEDLPNQNISNVEDGSITSLLNLRVGYNDSIVTDFRFNQDIFAPLAGAGQMQSDIIKLDEVWQGGAGGFSVSSLIGTFVYVITTATEQTTPTSIGQTIRSTFQGGSDLQEILGLNTEAFKTVKALEEAAANPQEIDFTQFLIQMNKYYTKFQKINQSGAFHSSDDTADRLNALYSFVNSTIFRDMFMKKDGSVATYSVNGKSIKIKSQPRYIIDKSFFSDMDNVYSLQEFLRKKGLWEKNYAEFPFTATVTTLGIPEVSDWIVDWDIRKIRLQISNPRLPEGPKHWTSGIYIITSYTHNISAGSMYTTTFELLRQPFAEIN